MCSCFDTIPACDRLTERRTDGQTDGISVASTVLAMRALRRAVKTEPTHDLLLRGVSKIIRYVIIITVTMCGCPSVMSQVVTVM